MYLEIQDTDESFSMKMRAEGDNNADKQINLAATLATCFILYPQFHFAAKMAITVLEDPEGNACKAVIKKAQHIVENRNTSV